MPNALAIGVSYELFWHLSPTKLKAFEEAYMIKRKMRDEEMWYMGQYVASALNSTVCNAELWRGKNGKTEKYVEKPFMSELGKNNLTQEELDQRELQKMLLYEEQWQKQSKRNGLPETVIM